MVVYNKAKCLKCGNIIESKHHHDFVTCECGNVSVDGGHEYIRRLIHDDSLFEELSEEVEHEYEPKQNNSIRERAKEFSFWSEVAQSLASKSWLV